MRKALALGVALLALSALLLHVRNGGLPTRTSQPSKAVASPAQTSPESDGAWMACVREVIAQDQRQARVCADGAIALNALPGRLLFRPEQALVEVASGEWSLAWGWASVEGLPPSKAVVAAEGAVVHADHGPVQETFENRPDGVEHTIRVLERPARDGLRVRIDVSAELRATCTAGTPEIRIADERGTERLAYKGILAWSADGRRLAATLGCEEGAILMSVDDAGATYPVTIDPLISPASWIVDWTNQASAGFGITVSSAGDVNGDGFSEVIVGANQWDGEAINEGRAYVFFGSSTGLATAPAWQADPTDETTGFFAFAVASAGDVNGDGYGDVIIGAPEWSPSGEGRAYVYHGSATGLSLSPDWTADPTDQNGAWFGSSVASAGDVNGDGFSDVIVGARAWDGAQLDEGRAFVFYGSATGLGAAPVWSVDPTNELDARFGATVSSAGDVNADGFSDVVIGAYLFNNQATDEGAAFAYYGSAAGLSTTPDWQSDPTNQLNAWYGYSVASAGDVNGDGFSDVVVGGRLVNAEAPEEGRAYVYYGSAGGLSAAANWAVDPTDRGNAYFGYSVASAGDVNGDGYSDVVVSSENWWDGATFPAEGRAYLYLGAPGGLSVNPVWASDPTNQDDSRFGESVACAGDVNGDGFSDVIVGAFSWTGEAVDEGRAYVYLGSTQGLSTAPSWTTDPTDQLNAQYGCSIASAGDVNSDGFDDVVVGAQLFDAEQTNEGRAWLFLGSSTGLSTTAAWTADPTDQADAEFGGCVARAGDVNGDGYSDVLVGAFLLDDEAIDEGRAYLYLGGPGGLSSTPDWTSSPTDQVNAEFGFSLAGAGDVNGDGFADIAVGAWLWDSGSPNEGRVYVFHGSATGPAATADWTSDPTDQAGARFGYSVAGAGDVNADGFSDLVVGANLWNGAQTDEGRAFAFHGSATGLGAAPAWTADPTDQNAAQFGASVAGAGDVNRDGFSDVLIGAPLFDAEQTDEGRAYLYAGSAGGLGAAPLSTADPTDQLTARFGWSVAGAGDVNADGFADVVVGADGFDAEQSDEGRAYVYHGNAAGLPASPSWTADPTDQANAQFGYSVATAGDVNADGFADIVVGAFEWNGAVADEGRAFAHYGLGDTGIPPRAPSLQQFREDGTTVIRLGGMGGTTVVLRGRLINNGPIGGRLALQAEVKPIGTPFDGTGLRTGATAPSGSLGSVTVSGLADGAKHWRVRVVWPGGGSSRWYAFGANDEGATDLRVDATPPTVPALSSPADLAVLGDTTPALDWNDSTDAGAGVLDYDVEVDDSAAFTVPLAWSSTETASDATSSVLAEGSWFWHVRARDGVGNVSAWSPSRSFTIDTTPPVVPAGVVLAPNGGNYVKGGAVFAITWDSAAIADPNLAPLPIVLEYSVDGVSWAPIAAGEANDGAYNWTVPLLNSALVRIRVSADDSAGNRAGDISDATFIVDSANADEVITGLGAGGRGWVQTYTNLPVGLVSAGWQQVPWAAYTNAIGETRPACGDVDGDGRDELVTGFGSYPSAGGWVVIRDDAAAGYAILRWVRVPWTAYNAADGQTRPACADFDGDGRAEIAVGLGPYPAQGGRCALFQDASAGYAFWRWVDVPWADYNAANGETRPAGGDFDGDGRAELVVGLGTYTAMGGRAVVLDDGASGFAFVRWLQLGWAAYNGANGETWPAVGNLDGDAPAEVILGLGTYTPSGGWFRAIDDYVAGNVGVGWGRVNWVPYNAADGEVRPACGDVDGDGRAEVLLGLARYPAAGGWINIHDDLAGNLASLRWVGVEWPNYNGANGETWPAAGDVR